MKIPCGERSTDQSDPGTGLELVQQVPDVILDVLRAYVHGVGDVAGREVQRDELQHVALAMRQDRARPIPARVVLQLRRVPCPSAAEPTWGCDRESI